MNKSRTNAASGAGAASTSDDDAPGREEIDAQIRKLREDMAGLAQMLRAAGSARWEEARGQAEAMPDEALAELQRQLHRLEDEARARVQAQPMRTLGLAALAGFLLGLVLRR